MKPLHQQKGCSLCNELLCTDFAPLKLYLYVCKTWISYSSVSAWKFLAEWVTVLCHFSQAVWPITNKGVIIYYSQTSGQKENKNQEEVKTRLNFINIHYHSVLDLSSSCFPFRNLYIHTYKTICSYNLIRVSNTVFHSKERTQIKDLWEQRSKMTYGLEENEKVTY